MNWTVWCDGSGTSGGPAGIAYYAVCDELDGTYTGSLPLANATNQQAEILAAAYALHELPKGSEITVVSDSEYVVRGMNEWLPRAIGRGWRRSTGGEVKNRRHFERLLEAVARHERVWFQWTRGHAGTEGNEQADKMAREARAIAVMRPAVELAVAAIRGET